MYHKALRFRSPTEVHRPLYLHLAVRSEQPRPLPIPQGHGLPEMQHDAGNDQEARTVRSTNFAPVMAGILERVWQAMMCVRLFQYCGEDCGEVFVSVGGPPDYLVRDLLPQSISGVLEIPDRGIIPDLGQCGKRSM